MFLEIHAETIVTHECRRTGQQIEDQWHATTYRVELAQLAGLLKPLAELIVVPPEMLAVFAEFERDILRDRVKAGIADARCPAPIFISMPLTQNRT